jgi:hypothetical protein
VRLPWQFYVSGIFRAQSGFHYSVAALTPVDVDGDGVFNGIDFAAGRNRFQAPGYRNVDVRFSKRFALREGVHIQAIFEFFNLLNRPNPAAVVQQQNMGLRHGTPLQYLPGREGQAGLRLEF